MARCAGAAPARNILPTRPRRGSRRREPAGRSRRRFAARATRAAARAASRRGRPRPRAPPADRTFLAHSQLDPSGHRRRRRAQLRNSLAPASPDFSGWNWVRHSGPARPRPRTAAVLGGGHAAAGSVDGGPGARTSARSRTASSGRRRRTARDAGGDATVFQPMCGTRGAASRVTPPGSRPSPLVVDAVLVAVLEQHLHADADAEHRPAGRDPRGDHRPGAERVDAGHAGRVRADARHDQAVRVGGRGRGRRSRRRRHRPGPAPARPTAGCPSRSRARRPRRGHHRPRQQPGTPPTRRAAPARRSRPTTTFGHLLLVQRPGAAEQDTRRARRSRTRPCRITGRPWCWAPPPLRGSMRDRVAQRPGDRLELRLDHVVRVRRGRRAGPPAAR